MIDAARRKTKIGSETREETKTEKKTNNQSSKTLSVSQCMMMMSMIEIESLLLLTPETKAKVARTAVAGCHLPLPPLVMTVTE